MTNPLSNVDFDKEFNLSSDNVQSEAGQAEEEKKEAPEIKQPTLDRNQIQDLEELRLIMIQREMQTKETARQIEMHRRAMERDLQLEERLEPLELADLVTKGELTQTIPVAPGQLELVFRTIPHLSVVLAEKVGKELAGEWGASKGSVVPEKLRVSTANIAQMVQALISVNGETGPGVELAEITDRTQLELAVKEKTLEWMAKPHALVEQITSQYLGFVIRVRNVLSHAGYVDQEVKKY